MFADDGPLYTCVVIPLKIYNSHFFHYQCLHEISDLFDGVKSLVSLCKWRILDLCGICGIACFLTNNLDKT